MFSRNFLTLAVLARLATTHAIPKDLLPRAANSSTYPASSPIAPYSSASSYISSSVPNASSSSSFAAYSSSIAASSSYLPSSVNTPAPTPPAAAPTRTWSIKVEVGKTSFNIGDADSSKFEDLWKGACDANGCDGGTPQTFTYNGITAGMKTQMSGQFAMTGNVDNNQGWTNSLLDAINAAFQKSKQCSQSTAESCNMKRDVPSVNGNCKSEPIAQCSAVNFVQATMYDDQSNQKAQVTMNGSSQEDEAFPCDTLLGAMNAGVTALDFAPPVAGALALAQVVCDAATAGKI
jgi:hypothetical protein